jgi:hypothetical protein
MVNPSESPIYLSKDGNVSGPFSTKQIEEMKRTGEYRTYTWIWDATTQNWAPINAPMAPPGPPGDGNTKTSVTKTMSAPKTATTVNLDPEQLLANVDEDDEDEDASPAPASIAAKLEKTNPMQTPAAAATQAAAPVTHRSLPGSRPSAIGSARTQGHAPSIPGLPAICHNGRSIIAGQLSEVSKDGCVFRSNESSRSLPDFQKGSRVKLNVLEEATGKSENLEAVIQKLTLHEKHWEFHLGWEKLPALLDRYQ